MPTRLDDDGRASTIPTPAAMTDEESALLASGERASVPNTHGRGRVTKMIGAACIVACGALAAVTVGGWGEGSTLATMTRAARLGEMPATLGRRRVGRNLRRKARRARAPEKKEVAAADSSDESADDEMPTTVNDKGDDESSNLGSYTFKRVGRGWSCEPVIPPGFDNAITMSNNIEPHKLSQSECTYIGKDLVPFVSKVAKAPSTCAPSNTIFISGVDARNYKILQGAIMNVRNQSCFMNRYVVVTFDMEAHEQCEKDGLNCIKWVDGHRFDRLRPDQRYVTLTWMKQKIQLGTLVAGVDFFIFDADVILFKVPDLEAVQKVDPEATIFYQRDFRSYLQYYAGAEKKNPDTTGSPWSFNSGQIYMRATPETLAVQQSSLNLGPGGMEQAVLKYAIILAVREHKLRSAQLPVGYGTGCNPKFNGEYDWASPSVIKHLPEFTSMHACCGFGKLGGMLTVNARLKCLVKFKNAKLCTDKVHSEKDLLKLESDRAPLGDEASMDEYTEDLVRRSIVNTFMARYQCALRNPDDETCAEKTVLAMDDDSRQ
tara:strand:+ start:133 stop:1770 length:1638 start_codon:yes stop_codon:yes gene_type:complete